MPILRINKKQVTEAAEARSKALKSDPEYRRDDEERQREVRRARERIDRERSSGGKSS